MNEICDNRDLQSSAFRETRDRFLCGKRNYREMALKPNDLRRWLATKLEERGRGARSELARHMGLTPDQITRMSNWRGKGEKREISAAEMAEIVEFFGEGPGGEREDHAPPEGEGIREVDMRAGLGGGGFESREVVRNGSHVDALKSETWRFPASFMPGRNKP